MRTLWPLLLISVAFPPGCLDPTGRPIPQVDKTSQRPPFDETGSFPWKVVWGMSQAEFGRHVSKYQREGYRPHDLEAYRDEGNTRFAGIFLKDGRGWQVRWRSTRSQFDRDFKTLRAKGYQLVDLEIVKERQTLRYSSVWISNPGGPAWRARWGLTHGEFLDELEQYRGQGYRPTDLEIYGTGNRTRYAYVMARDPGRAPWQARWGKTSDTIGAAMDSMTRQGYRIADFEPSYPQGKLRFSAIFIKDARRRNTTWTMSRSGGQIKREIKRLGSRYRPVHLAIGPHKEGGLAYLVVWQQN